MLDHSPINVLFDLYMMYNKTYVFAGMDVTSIMKISLSFALGLNNSVCDFNNDFEHRRVIYLTWNKRTTSNASLQMEDVAELELCT